METSCSYTGDTAYFSSDERRWHTRIKRLAKEYPNEVVIIRMPEENDGCIYARIPSEFLKIGPNRTLNLTDEQRAACRERMAKYCLKGGTE